MFLPSNCEIRGSGESPRWGSGVPGQTDVLHTHLPAVHVLKQRPKRQGLTLPGLGAMLDSGGAAELLPPALSFPISKMGGGDSTPRLNLMTSATQRC